MKITRFEDIEAWKEARLLVSMVYESTGNEPFKKDWGLKDQVQRAAVSVMSNIAEGFMSQTNKKQLMVDSSVQWLKVLRMRVHETIN